MFTKTLKPAAVIAAAAIAFSGALLSATPAVASGLAPQATVATTQLPDFVQLVEKYGKGVVNISTVREARVVEGADPFGFDERHAEIFRRFGFPFPFGGGPRQEPERRGTGSGFIISADGLILTNHHVVDGADEIKVRLTDNREFTGKVLGSDAKTDIAVVKIEAKDLPYLTMGNSDELKVGEWVAAIGSPFGLDNTVTSGIVSAKSRKLPSDQYVPFIQTDVAVNPGNSGGPLFNMKGEVVGINSQIFSTSGGFMGLSFAIPIDLAMQIKDQLVKDGYVTRGYVGVYIQELSQELAETFGLKTPEGALVTKIEKDSPAEKAGLREGDVITALDGKKVTSSVSLPMLVSAMKPGDEATLTVIRDKKEKAIDITIGTNPNQDQSAGDQDAKTTPRLGLEVRPLTAEEAKTAETTGLLVANVTGAAAKAGVRKGDILVSANGKPLKSARDLANAAKEDQVLLLVQRDGGRIFIPIRTKTK